MNACVTTTVDVHAAQAHARPGALMFQAPVLDALTQALKDGQRATYWNLNGTLVEVRVLAVNGDTLLPSRVAGEPSTYWSPP